MVRSVGRGLTVLVGALAVLLLGTTVAAAHVEVTVAPAQAGARDAVVTFVAEAESDTAGVNMLQVQLPAGIGPGDVTLVSGPDGWVLTPTNDGYTVAGPPLAAGADATYAIKVKQLPNAPSVAFKTLQTYTDGTIDRWIELPTPGGPAPANPAPVATLTAAVATTSSPTAPPTSSAAPTSRTEPSNTAAAPAAEDGIAPGVWWGVAALAVTLAVLVLVLVIRRRARRSTE